MMDETSHESPDAITAYNPFQGNRLGLVASPIATAASTDRTVQVEFADGSVTFFHHQRLRHCCYCQACGNPADGIRFNTVISFESEIAPTSVSATDSDLTVT
jgi:hypothetical protein